MIRSISAGVRRVPGSAARAGGGVVVVLIVALLLAAMIYGPEAWGRYLYVSDVRGLQAQCLQYTARADEVVYDTDPLDRSALLGTAGYHAFNDWAVFAVPAKWHAFRAPYACPDGTAFVHARRAASGPERLVGVDIIPAAGDVLWLR